MKAVRPLEETGHDNDKGIFTLFSQVKAKPHPVKVPVLRPTASCVPPMETAMVRLQAAASRKRLRRGSDSLLQGPNYYTQASRSSDGEGSF